MTNLLIRCSSHDNIDAPDTARFQEFLNSIREITNSELTIIDNMGIIMGEFSYEEEVKLAKLGGVREIIERKPLSISDSY